MTSDESIPASDPDEAGDRDPRELPLMVGNKGKVFCPRTPENRPSNAELRRRYGPAMGRSDLSDDEVDYIWWTGWL